MPDAGASRKQRFDAIESVSQIGLSRSSNRGYVNFSSPRVGPASRFARGSESIQAGQCDVVSFTAYRALRFPPVRGAPWMVECFNRCSWILRGLTATRSHFEPANKGLLQRLQPQR
jgi:hypothetical protein